MKKFLLTVLLSASLVGCNKAQEPKAPELTAPAPVIEQPSNEIIEVKETEVIVAEVDPEEVRREGRCNFLSMSIEANQLILDSKEISFTILDGHKAKYGENSIQYKTAKHTYKYEIVPQLVDAEMNLIPLTKEFNSTCI